VLDPVGVLVEQEAETVSSSARSACQVPAAPQDVSGP